MSFKNGQKKALTFSFDDGNEDDVRLVGLLNRYGLKGTFNLNAGLLSHTSSWNFEGGKEVRHINYTEHPHLYDGHEIACHTYTHPHLEALDAATLENEIVLDKKVLEYLYGCEIHGMALPFGSYNDAVIQAAAENGMAYCRTTWATQSFSPPDSLLLHPTCHFLDGNIGELARQFLESETKEPQLFYIWGHSYELVTEDDWAAFEGFCKSLSGREDIWYCTNIEAIKAIQNKETGRDNDEKL